MIDSGITLQARRLAVQYGDCQALAEFWRACLHTYNRMGKVRRKRENMFVYNSLNPSDISSGSTDLRPIDTLQQWKVLMGKQLLWMHFTTAL